MGLFKNLKKAISKSSSSKINERVKSFPSIIDEEVKPVDVATKDSEKKEEKSLDLPKLNIIKPSKTNLEHKEDIRLDKKEFKLDKKEFKLDTNKDSFFLNLYNQVNIGKVNESDFVNENVLLKMKDYWKNDSSLIESQSENEQRKTRLRDMLNETLKELTGLEDKWRSLRVEQEKINYMVREVESEIEEEGLKFKELVRKLKFHENVIPDKKFKLFDGKEINNLFELLGALKMMSDTDFSNHVNDERNDFATWVETSLNEPEVAKQIREIKDRQTLTKFLEEQLNHEGLK